MIKAILFDSGGVLIKDVFVTGIFESAFSKKYPVSIDNFTKLRREVWSLYKVGKITEVDLWNHIYRGLGLAPNVAEARALYYSLLELVPETMDLLPILRKKYTLILANNEGKEFDWARDKKFNFFKYFDFRFSSWLIGLAKPHAEFFNYILKATGFLPEECLLIDNQQNNIDGAKAMGIKGILFTSAEALKEELEDLKNRKL